MTASLLQTPQHCTHVALTELTAMLCLPSSQPFMAISQCLVVQPVLGHACNAHNQLLHASLLCCHSLLPLAKCRALLADVPNF
jgi:hypothetical protein